MHAKLSMSRTQQFTDVSGVFCGGKTVYFQYLCKVGHGQGALETGTS